MAKYVSKILVPSEEIQQMVQRLGKEITEEYKGKKLLLIGVLKGAFVFMSDLVRAIDIPLQVDFMAVSSYGSGMETSGVVKILKDCDIDISGKHVIVVEDIIDSGLTMTKLMEMLSTRNPASIALCSAFDKPSRRRIDVPIRFRGIEIPDEFIVGYGLDYDGFYRNLPDVCVLAEDEEKEDWA